MNYIYEYTDIKAKFIFNQLNELGLVDIYHHPDFLKIHIKKEEELLFFVIENKGIFYLPFKKKKIKSSLSQEKYFVFETIHGYSGPIATSENEIFLNDCWKKFKVECTKLNIVSGFIRFNPFLKNHYFAKNINFIKIIPEKKIIADKITEKYDFYFNNYSKNAKYNLKKAYKNNLVVNCNNNLSEKKIIEFSLIYKNLMKEKKTNDTYKYSKSYFIKLLRMFKNNLDFFCIYHDGQMVAGMLLLCFKNIIHIHLSASNNTGKKMNCSYILRDLIFQKYQLSGKIINFGGGTTNSENDNLYKFKANFIGKTKNFYIGKVTTNLMIHNHLTNEYIKMNNGIRKNFHLVYV